MMWFALGLTCGYALHRVLMNLGGKPVYTEQDLLYFGETEYSKGYHVGFEEGRYKR